MSSNRPPRTRNSIPGWLARTQTWLESEALLRRLLPVEADADIRIVQVRRNFKFRKMLVEAGDSRYICYTHYWPRGMRNLAWFSEQAGKVCVNVPHPVSVHTGWRYFLTERAFSLVLPYIEGRHLGHETSSDNIAGLGHTLGRLHNITSTRWGPLLTNFPRHGSYWQGLQKYWRLTAKQLREQAPFASDQEIARVLIWLSEHGAHLAALRQFNLTHGDPASGNFLLQANGELYLIDCDRIGFEPGPMELANALLQDYCADHGDRQMTLVQAYLESCPQDVRALWEAHAQFYIAAALVWRCQRKLQWALKRPDSGNSRERAELAWRRLPLVIQARSPDWRAALALLGD